MISKRLPRRLTVGGLGATIVLGLILSLPAATVAATPGWTVTSTSKLPGTGKPGGIVGYSATVFNAGNSNISQFSMTAWFEQPYAPTEGLVMPPPGYAQVPEYAAIYKNGNLVTNGCPKPWGAPVICTPGALGSGETATLVVAYRGSGMDGAGIHAWAASTGSGSTFCTSGDNSHGDCLPINIGPTTFNASANFDGGFTVEPNTQFITDQVLGPANLFATSFKAGAAFIPVTIEDDTTYAPCPTGQTCFGTNTSNAVQLNVNQGQVFTNPFSVVIKVYKDAVPSGGNGKKATVVHYFDDPIRGFEEISNDCPKNKTPTTTCRDISWDGKAGVYTITIWLFENGYVKFH